MSTLIQLQKRIRTEENKRRAARMREEREFMANIKKNYRLSHLEEIRARLAIESESRSASAQAARTSPAKSPQDGALSAHTPASDGLRCTAEIEASVACIAVTDGGATLWTAEADGSIGIRRGDNGSMVYSIAGDVGRTVTALAAYESSIFVGFSDGTLRVYDPHVFILAFEHMHEGDGAIAAFSQTFNEKTFSATGGGRIAKWDNETNEFACVATCELRTAVSALCSYGYQLFIGCGDGVIRIVDTDTVQPCRSFEGHTGGVAALIIVDGFLISGSADTTIGIWSIGTGEMLYSLSAHAHPVVALVPDTVSHQLWTADAEGCVNLWTTNPDRGFQHLRQVDAMRGCLRTIVGAVAVDSVKLWSLASNGDNKSWHVTNNRVEEGIRHALNTMRTIIDQDRTELSKWADLTDTLRTVAQSLRETLSDSTASLSHSILRRKAFNVWSLLLLHRRVFKVRRCIAVSLSRESDTRILHPYFGKLAAFAMEVTEARQLESTARVALSEHKRLLVRNYAAKMRSVGRLDARLSVLGTRSMVTTHSTMMALRRRYYANLVRWRQKCVFFRQRDRLADLVLMQMRMRFTLGAFQQWRVWIRGRRLEMVRQQLTSGMQHVSTSSLMWSCFRQWLTFRRLNRSKRLRSAQLHVCCALRDASTFRHFFRLWLRRSLQRTVGSLADRRDHNATHLVELASQLAELDGLNVVRKQILAVDSDIASLQARKDSLIASLAAVREDRAETVARIATAGEARAADTSLHQQLPLIMERLKLRLIDLSRDAGLILKTSEKIARVGAVRLFLESHAQIKRTVVCLVGSESTPPHWGATFDNIQHLKVFETEVVVGALRNIVISYDALSPAELRSMSTDDEIGANEEALYMLAEQCVVNRDKRRRSSGQRK